MDSGGSFPIHQGYLTKSPPDSGITGRMMKSWRKRWFVLRGDKNLEYYDDRAGRLKKTIDLSLCTCLDKNLFHKRFKNVFSIKVKGKSDHGKQVDRSYFLVADSPYEMDMWVDHICKICEFQKLEDGGIGPAPRQEISQTKEITEKTSVNRYHSLSDAEKRKSDERPDSGIHDPENDNTCELPNYDIVPAPRELRQMSEESDYDVPPQANPTKLPSTIEYDYDSVPLPQPAYAYDIPSPQPAYDIPQPTYDVPPTQLVANARQTDSNISQQITNIQLYDQVPQHNTSCYDYDTVPPVDSSDTYDYVPPPVIDQPTYDIVPPTYDIDQPTYDIVPPPVAINSPIIDQPTYDIVPPKLSPQIKRTYVNLTIGDNIYNKPLPCPPGLTSGDERDSGTVADMTMDENCYDIPPYHYSGRQDECFPPSVNRSNKPGPPAPLVNRASKPGQQSEYVNLPKSATFREPRPQVLRSNLQRSRSAASDHGHDQLEGYLYMESPKRTETSSRFSKKERYLNTSFEETEEDSNMEYEYMASKRNSDDSYENFAPQDQSSNTDYENFAPQDRSRSSVAQRNDITSTDYENFASPDQKQLNILPTKQITGHYQEIAVVPRHHETSPSRIPKTNYTTIDLEKTRGFRITCEQLNKK